MPNPHRIEAQWAAAALQLCRLLHHDEAVAASIAERAAKRLGAAADAQRKRLYYVPSEAQKQAKVYLGEPALLQMLVYAESETFERASERRGLATPTMIASRYVKHLVAIGARRNSFHAALAVCRLLFGYSTSETMDLYGALLHADDFIKEDYYYRARKRLLMREIEQRFSAVVRIRGARSEERFALAAEQQEWAGIVEGALSACTPWGTACVGDPLSLALRRHAESERLHALIHPPCFRALAAAASVEPPERRLAMPFLGFGARHSENATVAAPWIGTIAAAALTHEKSPQAPV